MEVVCSGNWQIGTNGRDKQLSLSRPFFVLMQGLFSGNTYLLEPFRNKAVHFGKVGRGEQQGRVG